MADENTQLDTLDDEDFEASFETLVDNEENSVDLDAAEPEEPMSSEDSDTDDEDSVEEDSEETEDLDEDDEEGETEDDESADTEDTSDSEEEESPEDTEEVSEDTEDDSEDEDDSEEELDYKASYKALMEPLKVSGKEVKIRSMKDLRSLASMGIDYSRKMHDVKPLRAIGETLTEAGLYKDGIVDEEKLTRLVDIQNGNKEAIAQLLVEHGIDPLDDLDVDNVNYQSRPMVSQDSIALKEVEQELVSRGSVDSVIDRVSKMDKQSKQFFEKSPAALLNLEQDIKNGVYDEVMSTIQYERTLGRLNGVSDIDAYIQLVTSDSSETPAPKEVEKPAKPSVQKRKAAGITKRKPVKSNNKPKYDFVNMSDEEFEKLIPTDSLY